MRVRITGSKEELIQIRQTLGRSSKIRTVHAGLIRRRTVRLTQFGKYELHARYELAEKDAETT